MFEVRFSGTENFHPKLWFIKYQRNGDKSNAYIRLIVLSRNLTFDRSLDYAVALTGDVKKRPCTKNAPLVDLLNFAALRASKKKKQKIHSLAKDVATTRFTVEAPFDDYGCIAFGLGEDTSPESIFGKCEDIIVVSPFLDGDKECKFLKELSGVASGKKTLFTRKSSLNNEIFTIFDEVYIVKDALLEQDIDNEDSVSPNPCDLHAKLYFTHSQRCNCLYVGSTNASRKGFSANIEFLLRLRLKTRQLDYKSMKSALLPEKCNPFMRIASLDEELPSVAESLRRERDFKEAMRSITDATVTNGGENDQFSLVINAHSCPVRASLAPLCSKTDRLEPLCDGLTFTGLAQEELSEFFILKVEGKEAVIKVAVKGIPATRDQAVYGSIIRDTDDLMNYFFFMLTGRSSRRASGKHKGGGDGDAKYTPISPALYENMLERMVENPKQVLELENVMNRLEKTKVSEEFSGMLSAFKDAGRGKVR
ncbi:phospholipase D family protein [Desulfovibrio sp. OttesenSCG-928-G15]|nr:phospholipase D family protein [Desulfovibrio sp. OttesenSCG-928-G15]